jgi:hypothetical protein
MKVEYEWYAGDGRGRMEEITRTEKRKPLPWWCRLLLVLLGVLVGAALVYSGYAVFS